MEISKNQLRLLKVLDILKMDSDQNNPLSSLEILERLEEDGLYCDRKTLYKDLETLKQSGHSITSVKSNPNKYYYSKREFKTSEIRMLLDMVKAAKCLTDRQSEDMFFKLAMLAGSRKTELFDENVIAFQERKSVNEQIFTSIDILDKAIENEKKVSFVYCNLDTFAYLQKKGERRIVNPLAMIFNDGFYYLCCYSEKYKDVVIYRLDRMSDVREEREKITSDSPKAEFKRSKLKDRLTAFGMWNGKEEPVTIRTSRKNIGDIYDKFGRIYPPACDKETITVKVKVNLSPVFFGWVASYGGDMEILSPPSARQAFTEMLKNALNLYSDE